MTHKINFDLKQLRSFLEIVKEGSFTRASRKLKIAQATISHQIQNLEETFGAPLLERSSKSISLTPEGQAVREYAEKILTDLEVLTERLEGKLTAGILRIAASTIPAAYLLPGIIARRENRQMRFSVEISDSREALELVKEGKADLGIVGKKIKHPSLSFSHVCSDEIVLAGPADAPDAIGKEELRSLPIISREKGSGTRSAAEDFLSTLGILPSELTVVYECTSTDGVRESIIRGIGYSFISRLAIERECGLGLLKTVALPGLPLKRDFYMVSLNSRKNIPHIEELHQALKKAGT